MRSMQLAQSGGVPTPNYQPHTPNMSALDVASPSVLTASPRNIVAGRQMQRDLSKGGSMLPPQSPATATQRTSTPKPSAAGRTPKIKEEQLVSQVTPNSHPIKDKPEPNQGYPEYSRLTANSLSIARRRNTQIRRAITQQRDHLHPRHLYPLVLHPRRPHALPPHARRPDHLPPPTSAYVRALALGRLDLAQLRDRH